MKSFLQTIQEESINDKLDKLTHSVKLSSKKLAMLKGDSSEFEYFDLEDWFQFPFPRNSSEKTKKEIQHLISLGQFRTTWEEEMMLYDIKVIQPFKDYLSKHNIEDIDWDRIKRKKDHSVPIILSLKRHYNRPRPKELAKELGLPLDNFPLKTAGTPSYPSGHATQGKLVSLLVADEVPLEHRKNILDIGKRIGYSRQVAGAHYSSDTDFGIRLGKALYDYTQSGMEPNLTLENIMQPVLLREASSKASTYFEAVVVKCHNFSSLNEKKFKDKIMKDPDIKKFLKSATDKKWATSGKTPEEQAQILFNLAKICKKKFGTGNSDAGAGQSNKTVSTFWNNETGKGNDVSKTDVVIAGKRASVKGPSAQLMSGKKPEVRATILAAAEAAGAGNTLRKSLLAATDKFVETTSQGAEMTTRELRKLSPEKAIETGNVQAQKVVQHQKELQAEVNKAFHDAFKNPKIAYEFAREAMTGTEKFSAKTITQNNSPGDESGEATHMLVWDYRMDRLMFKKIDKDIVSHSSKAMKVNAGFKSTSKKAVGAKTPTNPKGKVGYNIFQTLRISTDQLLDKQGEFVQQAQEEINKAGDQLNEGVISEFDFKGMVSKAWNWLKSKLQDLWNWFKNMINDLAQKIKDLINNYSIGDILQDFDGDVQVKFNNVVKFKVR